MGTRTLEHMRSVTDKVIALEAEKSALVIANANLTRDLADVKRALSRTGATMGCVACAGGGDAQSSCAVSLACTVESC